ncbi:anti-sigma factor [Streptomyces sp. NPDC000594]|uniref:anti-sigma factor n=1 Tax=Streptomyces sp. NPDC000594 TaxID=3154261 RepID=UPI00332F6784
MRDHASDVHSLAAAHALDALEPAEREVFTAHLRFCEACRLEAAEFAATAARLAAATARTPPASLKPRTLAALDGVRQLPPQVRTVPAARFAGPLRRGGTALMLAAGLAAAASFAGLALWQHREVERSEVRAREAERRLDDIGTVLAAPDARTVHGRTGDGALATVVASDRRNKAVLTVSGLPAPASGRTYQLWLDHDGTLRPAGFLRGDGSVLIDGDPADATAVGLTLEPSGGSPRPTTAPLLLLALPA